MSTLHLSEFLPYQLSVTSNAVSERIAKEYSSQFGLKIPEWRLLAVLGQGKPLSQRDLVSATLMDKVTVNRAARALADRGLIERAAHSSDRRSHLLALTPAGTQLYDAIAPVAMAMEERTLAGLSAAERAALKDMLARVRATATAGD